jgi:hypothetical protein
MSEYRNITIPDDFLTTRPLTPNDIHLWHKDDDYPNCELCSKKFTFFNRRHHCRNCGKIICDDCSMAQYTSAKQNPYSPHMVCKLCKYCVFSQQGKESDNCKQYMYDAKLLDDSLDKSDPEGGGYKHRKNKRSLRRRRTIKRSNIRRKNKKVTKRLRKSHRRRARR